jgi:hypothetical protein
MPCLSNFSLKLISIPSLQCASFMISQQLRIMNREQMINRLDLKNDLVVNHQIQAITTIHIDSFISKGHWFLPFNSKALLLQFICQACFVGCLQQTRPQLFMYCNCTADNSLRKLFENQFSVISVLSVVQDSKRPASNSRK